jgi:hypothetical protein
MLTKAQVAYPQILSAYDAVETWAPDQGHTVTGSPREVYFADFDAAGPDDPVTDIAFPVSRSPRGRCADAGADDRRHRVLSRDRYVLNTGQGTWSDPGMTPRRPRVSCIPRTDDP